MSLFDDAGDDAEPVEPARQHHPAPRPLGLGHVLIHVQLPASVDLDIFAGRAKARILELDERAIVYTVRQPAR